MTRKEVTSKFDEIVAFADIAEFIDTPVKRYSSGMYVRLAFAVAAHLDPEILIVDEVLAVGDAAFQKKCIGKMGSVAQSGRTIIIVSHTMSIVEKLADRALWMHEGRCCESGHAKSIINRYLDFCANSSLDETTSINNNILRRGSGRLRISKLDVSDKNGLSKTRFSRGESLFFAVEVKCFDTCHGFATQVLFKLGSYGSIVNTTKLPIFSETIKPGEVCSFLLEVDTSFLPAATYDLYFWLGPLDERNAEDCYDVLDGATAPLQIKEGNSTDIHTTTIQAKLSNSSLKIHNVRS